jgi:cell division protein FtsB
MQLPETVKFANGEEMNREDYRRYHAKELAMQICSTGSDVIECTLKTLEDPKMESELDQINRDNRAHDERHKHDTNAKMDRSREFGEDFIRQKEQPQREPWDVFTTIDNMRINHPHEKYAKAAERELYMRSQKTEQSQRQIAAHKAKMDKIVANNNAKDEAARKLEDEHRAKQRTIAMNRQQEDADMIWEQDSNQDEWDRAAEEYRTFKQDISKIRGPDLRIHSYKFEETWSNDSHNKAASRTNLVPKSSIITKEDYTTDSDFSNLIKAQQQTLNPFEEDEIIADPTSGTIYKFTAVTKSKLQKINPYAHPNNNNL